MMAFDSVFPELARRETRVLQTTDHAGAPATFAFQEFYCSRPGCDCRRVVLHVHWIERECVAASIKYAFEPSRDRGAPQISLDPVDPRGADMERLLALFTRMIAEDDEYRGRLHRHYAIWKQDIDEPTSTRGTPRSPRSPRSPRTPRARKGVPRAQPTSPSTALIAAKAPRAEGKLQQRFRKLLEKVDRLRQRARAWKDARPAIDREMAVYAALFDQQSKLVRDMVALLDRAHQHPRLTKADRKELAEVICTLAGDVIVPGDPEDDLKAIYNRHSRGDFDAEVATAEAEGVATIKSMIKALGLDLDLAGAQSIGDLERLARAQLEAGVQERAAAEQRRAMRKKSAKQVAADARRESERKDANKAVQDVYRALALVMHPDREQDPHERARKAELMREVNIAYEARDLLRLLELQLEVEQVDPTRVDALAEERLRHYNRLLEEQAKQLAAEADALELPFRMDLDLSPSKRLAPADVIARICADADEVRLQIAELVRDLREFEDVKRLKAWLSAQRRKAPYRDLEFDMFG